MKLYKYLTLILPLLLLSCAKEVGDNSAPVAGVRVGFLAGGVESRTTINENGIGTSWETGDKIALWATAEDGSSALSAEPFQVYYRDIPASKALFTTTLASAMAEGSYNYYATYPTPKSVSGTNATFTLPAIQDGEISSGAAIMIATPAQGTQLGVVTGAPESSDAYEIEDNHLSLQMNHAMHALKFFIPSTKWGFADGETVERIVVTMPQNIAGDVTLDYTDPASAVTTANGVKTINLNLKNNLGASSSAADLDFAAAAIIPTTAFADGDQMRVKAYSQSQMVIYDIPLSGRGAMLAGHITPVSIDCSSPSPLPRLLFRITGNNLGEQPYKITLTSSSTLSKWTSTSNHVYTYYTGSESKTIANGSGFDIAYDEAYISTLSGKQVTVTYESANAIVSNTITMPSMSAGNTYTINLTVPYLFAEDFSTMKNYSHKRTSAQIAPAERPSGYDLSTSEYGLSAGWTGAHTGGNNGVMCVYSRVDEVTIAFVGNSTRTYGRLDAPAMTSLKNNANVNIRITFDYGGGREGNSTFYPVGVCGYTMTEGAISAKAEIAKEAAWEDISSTNAIANIPTNGSWSTPLSMSYTLSNVNASYRLSWQAMGLGYKGGGWATINGIQYLFIDNIKVSIVQ
ncbi:MAG: hypothetical protein J6L75_03655 [Alistipes sp.]|nr:hypothetical protein [Alistipes sp.]